MATALGDGRAVDRQGPPFQESLVQWLYLIQVTILLLLHSLHRDTYMTSLLAEIQDGNGGTILVGALGKEWELQWPDQISLRAGRNRQNIADIMRDLSGPSTSGGRARPQQSDLLQIRTRDMILAGGRMKDITVFRRQGQVP